MPSHYTLQTLPVPVDRSVHLVTVPAETMAVLRFSGSIAPETIAVKQQELISPLAAKPMATERRGRYMVLRSALDSAVFAPERSRRACNGA